MFSCVEDARDEVTVSFRDLNAAAFDLAERLCTPDAGPTAWRFLREHIRGRGWQNFFSVWQNFPGSPGARAVISPQENEVTIWAAGEKGVTMPFRNWHSRVEAAWRKACLGHLRPYIPGSPDPILVYQLVDIATEEDGTPLAEGGWRILWATPVGGEGRSHSPHGRGGLVPCLQIFSPGGATAIFGEGVVEMREPGNTSGKVLDLDDDGLNSQWAALCRAVPPKPGVARQEAKDNEHETRVLTFIGEEAEALRTMKSLAELTHGYVKWSITRERAGEPPVMRVSLDWPGK